MLGGVAEIDECKLSLISVFKKNHWYSRLSDEEKQALEELDELIHARLWLIIVLDVASCMPLGWVLTETHSAEATCAAVRMASRDKIGKKNHLWVRTRPDASRRHWDDERGQRIRKPKFRGQERGHRKCYPDN